MVDPDIIEGVRQRGLEDKVLDMETSLMVREVIILGLVAVITGILCAI